MKIPKTPAAQWATAGALFLAAVFALCVIIARDNKPEGATCGDIFSAIASMHSLEMIVLDSISTGYMREIEKLSRAKVSYFEGKAEVLDELKSAYMPAPVSASSLGDYLTKH